MSIGSMRRLSAGGRPARPEPIKSEFPTHCLNRREPCSPRSSPACQPSRAGRTRGSRSRRRKLTHLIAQVAPCGPLHDIEQHRGEREDQYDCGHEGRYMSDCLPLGESKPLPKPADYDEDWKVHHVNRIGDFSEPHERTAAENSCYVSAGQRSSQNGEGQKRDQDKILQPQRGAEEKRNECAGGEDVAPW